MESPFANLLRHPGEEVSALVLEWYQVDCVDWTSNFGFDIGAFGFVTTATSFWTDSGGNGCNLPFRLYCFEQ